MENQKKRGFPPYIAFLLFNAAFFMMDTTNSYFQIYLNDIGMTKTMIGTIIGTAWKKCYSRKIKVRSRRVME